MATYFPNVITLFAVALLSTQCCTSLKFDEYGSVNLCRDPNNHSLAESGCPAGYKGQCQYKPAQFSGSDDVVMVNIAICTMTAARINAEGGVTTGGNFIVCATIGNTWLWVDKCFLMEPLNLEEKDKHGPSSRRRRLQ